MERRLAAILAADVVGYSRLMGEDEAGTLSALRQLRTEILIPKVDTHSGRIVKSMGDGWLVEFTSVIDAVNCAIEVQECLAVLENIKLRVGMHLGDITASITEVNSIGHPRPRPTHLSRHLQDAQPRALLQDRSLTNYFNFSFQIPAGCST